MPFRPAPLAVATVLALSSLPSVAHAEAAAFAGQAMDLDEIVVTATRTPHQAATALQPVEVIDRDSIERSQARSVPDLLRGRAGISLSNQGGAGKLTTLFLRGAESDQTVVLVDGVRIGSSTSGLASWQNLPVAQIDRIEIVRGPRSSLYGADAIGGVIHIFTRRDTAGFAPRVHVGGGSHGAHDYGIGLGGRQGRAWMGADYAFKRTEGFNSCDVAQPTPFSGGCFISEPEPDLDGYLEHSLSVRGGIDINDAWQVSAHALRSEGENEYDGDYSNRSDTVQQVVGGSIGLQVSDALQFKLTGGRNTDASDQFLGQATVGHFSTDRDSATLQADIGLADGHLLSLGADWLRDHVDGSTIYDQDDRANRAAFAQYQGDFGRHAVQASLRRDDNDQFGGHTTGGVAWGMEIVDGWRINAGYGTAFKAPTFNELYYPFFGNPELGPEESETAELGITWAGTGASARLDLFDTQVDDLIAFDAAIGLPNNIERARMRGAELGVGAGWAGWDLAASVSVLDTENRSGFNAGNELPRRAKHGARIELDRAFGDLRIGFTGIAEGARYDDVANTMRLPGYATLDLRLEYALTEALVLQGRLANLLDRDYETAAFYNQPGREWFVTLRWAPQN